MDLVSHVVVKCYSNLYHLDCSAVQDTILKIVCFNFKIQYIILSDMLRYLFIVSYLSIFEILFKSISGKCKIRFQDTFPQILYFTILVHFLVQLHIKLILKFSQ